jgi:O-antigen/teichoic acid export membrane protein
LAFVALSPLLAHLFHSSIQPLLWTSLAIALSIFVSAGFGLLQGMQRFSRLAVSLLAGGVCRIVAGGALVAAGWGPSGALAAVAIGFAASGLLVLAPGTSEPAPGRAARPAPAPSAQSLAAILVASIAISVPTSLDVALVKHFFSGTEAGMFTAVAVLGRVVLFLPAAISFIALPKVAARVSQGGDPSFLLWSSLAQTGVLATGVAVSIVLMTSGLGWSPAGADVSGALAPLNWYLPAMVAFALVVTVVYYQIGCGNTRYIFLLLLPATISQVLAVVLFRGSLASIAQALFVVNVVLLALSLLPATAQAFRNYGPGRRTKRAMSAAHPAS